MHTSRSHDGGCRHSDFAHLFPDVTPVLTSCPRRLSFYQAVDTYAFTSVANANLARSFSVGLWVQPVCDKYEICMLLDTRGGVAGKGALVGLLPSAGTAPSNCTQVPLEQKVDCGFSGITEEECRARNCCFVPINTSGPYCFTTHPAASTPSVRQPYFYPAFGEMGDNLPSPLNITVGAWNYIGVTVIMPAQVMHATGSGSETVDANNGSVGGTMHGGGGGDRGYTNGTVQFFINGVAGAPQPLARPSLDGRFGGAVVKLQRFLGEMRAVGTFPDATLTLEEHNAFANQYVKSVLHSPFTPASDVAPTPAVLMDPTDPLAMVNPFFVFFCCCWWCCWERGGGGVSSSLPLSPPFS